MNKLFCFDNAITLEREAQKANEKTATHDRTGFKKDERFSFRTATVKVLLLSGAVFTTRKRMLSVGSPPLLVLIVQEIG